MLRTELIRPLPEVLRAQAHRFGEKVAFRDGRLSVSYAELERRTRRLAGHLAGLRIQPGDRAAIYLQNCVEMVESYLAITRASGIGVPLNPQSTDAELEYLLDDSGTRVIITDPSRVPQLRRVLKKRQRLRVVVTGDAGVSAAALPGAVSYAVLTSTEPTSTARDDLGLDDLAWMLYTSGTTGKPKGVLSTQRNCLWSVAACYVPVPGLCAEDRILWPLPLFHSLAHIVCVLGVTVVGATACIVDDLSAEDLLNTLVEESSTFLAGVPTMYHYLVRASREKGFAAPSLRMCLIGGSVTSASLRRSFEEAFGAPLLDAYGSTETCGSTTINWPTGARVEGSCGLPVVGLGVRLVDPGSGIDVADGQEGEVWVRGPSVMVGYHNDPDATDAALRGGWYHTGDLARRDEAGYFTIVGRIKELIIRGGESVHPGEVEDVLRGVPGVADAAVVGKPHEVLGEVPVAFLVPGPGGFDPERVFAACRERLSYFKSPEELYEIDRVPRTALGKITRHVLLGRPARLRAAGSSHYESLFRLDWIPLPLPSTPRTSAGRWAVVGTDPLGLSGRLADAGIKIDIYPELSAVHDAVAADGLAADITILYSGTSEREASHPAGAADRSVRELAGQVEYWLAEECLAASRLVIVTRRAVSTSVEDDIEDLARAPLWGLMRCAQVEHPDRFTLVDLDVADEAAAAALSIAVSAGEPQLAVRAGVVLLPRLARVPVPVDQAASLRLDPQGVVLVTGAEEAAGAAVARHLVTGYRARNLLLISALGHLDTAAAELKAELTRMGAKVTLAACDVADRQALAAILAKEERPLTAIMHAQRQPDAISARTLRSAVAGALNLDELTQAMDLAAFVLFSSSAGALGASGRGDQAAAAVFLDAVAQRRHARGLAALSLASGAWGRADPQGTAQVLPSGVGTLSEQDTLAMFDAAHTTENPFVVAMRLDTLTLQADGIPTLLRGLIDAPIGANSPDQAASAGQRRQLTGLSDAEQDDVLPEVLRYCDKFSAYRDAGYLSPP